MESDPSSHPRLTISAIMISVVLMGMGTALQSTAVSLRAGLEDFASPLIGLILAAYYVGMALGSLLAPRFIRTVGYVRTFAAFASLASITSISHVVWINPLLWVLLRGGLGICIAIMMVVVESWLNAASTRDNRGRILSLYSVAYIGSMGLGQPLIGLYSPAGFEIFGITTILVSLCLIPITLTQVTGDPLVERKPPNLAGTFLKSPLGGFGILVSGILFGATWSLAPRYGQLLGMANNQVGIFMFLIALGTLTLQWPLGWLSDRRDRRLAILGASGAGFAAALILVFLSSAGFPLFFTFFLFGGTTMPLYSLCIALVNDKLSPKEMVQAAGAIIIYYGIGSAVGPVLGSAFMARFGPGGLFLFLGAVLALTAGAAALQLSRTPRTPRSRKTRYRPYPRTTQTALSLLRKKRTKKSKPAAP